MTQTNDRPTAELTELQRQVYDLLLEHRYYNEWTKQPTVALQQNWIAKTLRVQQGDVSNALLALRKAKLIARCGQPRMARPQIYFLTDPMIEQRDDTPRRLRAAWKHIDPNPEEIRKTASPLGQGRREDPAYEIDA